MRTHVLVLAAALAAAPAAALTVLTGSVKAPDGVEIRYEAAGNGEPAIVFVHCWSCDRTYWSEQAAYFARSQRIVAIDLAGHGESGLGRQRYTIEAFGADVKAVVDALGLEAGGSRRPLDGRAGHARGRAADAGEGRGARADRHAGPRG